MSQIRTLQDLADAVYSPDPAKREEVLKIISAHADIMDALHKSTTSLRALSDRSPLSELPEPIEITIKRGEDLLRDSPKQMNKHDGRVSAVFLRQGMIEAGAVRHPDKGEIEMVDWVANFAPLVDEYLATDPRSYPGTFHYEVTPMLGGWLGNNPDATPVSFKAEVGRMTDEWIRQHETHYPRSGA